MSDEKHKHVLEWRISKRKNLGAAASVKIVDYIGNKKRKDPKPEYVCTVKKGAGGAWVKENGDKQYVYLVEQFIDGVRVDKTVKHKLCWCGLGEEITSTFHQKWVYSEAKGWHATQYKLDSELVSHKLTGGKYV